MLACYWRSLHPGVDIASPAVNSEVKEVQSMFRSMLSTNCDGSSRELKLISVDNSSFN